MWFVHDLSKINHFIQKAINYNYVNLICLNIDLFSLTLLKVIYYKTFLRLTYALYFIKFTSHLKAKII